MDQNAEQALQAIKTVARFCIADSLRTARTQANRQALSKRSMPAIDDLELGRVYGIQRVLQFDDPEIQVVAEAAINEIYYLANYARRQQLRLLGARQ